MANYPRQGEANPRHAPADLEHHRLAGPAITWLCLLLAAAAFLVFRNIRLYSLVGATHGLWFDEGVNVLVSVNLAREGKYGRYHADGSFDFFPPNVTTGPAVLLPIAGAIAAGGDPLVSGRLVMGLYLLLAVTVFYLLVDWVHGWRAAALATAFFLTGALGDPLARGTFPFEPVTHTRFVIGEVPGFAFVVLGILLWGKGLNAQRTGRRALLLLLAGLSWGMAIQSKLMFVLALAVLGIWSIVDRQRWDALALPMVGSLVPAVSWLGYQVASVGSAALGDGILLGWPMYGPNEAGLVDTLPLLVSRVYGLSGLGFLVFSLPGILLALMFLPNRQREARRSVQGFLLLFVLVWLGWFVASALGRTRHALPGLFVMNVFFAEFVSYLGDGLRLPTVRSFRTDWRSNDFWASNARTLLVTIAALLLLLNPAKRLLLNVERDVTDSPHRVVQYLEQSGALQSAIAASESELDLLLGRPLYDIVWEDDRLPDDLRYFVCGTMVRRHMPCPPSDWVSSSQLVFSAEDYDVYCLDCTE